ncbi:hypothetical protein DSO57_1021312 [Entomophthora muscae]|uniref:Uncharacterized protein n=1 Tax=Entomophthora muscae TaxID=34485 RepID=A0ACC2SGH4_9FUNG|nr:hypothetical protein DSO57_1021312 [Entomophthora muscae]
MVYNSVFSLAATMYCLVVSVAVVVRIKRENLPLEIGIDSSEPKDTSYSLFRLRSLICQTCLYPSTCFLAYLGSSVTIIYIYIYKSTPSGTQTWTRLGYSSRGFLHLFAFLADPVILISIQKLAKATREKDRFKSDFYLVEVPSECGFSYTNITASCSSPYLRGRMIKEFQYYV